MTFWDTDMKRMVRSILHSRSGGKIITNIVINKQHDWIPSNSLHCVVLAAVWIPLACCKRKQASYSLTWKPHPTSATPGILEGSHCCIPSTRGPLTCNHPSRSFGTPIDHINLYLRCCVLLPLIKEPSILYVRSNTWIVHALCCCDSDFLLHRRRKQQSSTSLLQFTLCHTGKPGIFSYISSVTEWHFSMDKGSNHALFHLSAA